MPDPDVDKVAAVLAEADEELAADLAVLEGVDLDELHDFLYQPDPDTDGKDH